jgi:hypothetical protein
MSAGGISASPRICPIPAIGHATLSSLRARVHPFLSKIVGIFVGFTDKTGGAH